MLASISEHEHYRQKSIIIYCLPHSVGADIKHQKMKTLVLNTLGNDYTEQVKTLIMPMLNMTVGFRGGWMRHEMRYHPLNIGLLYKGNADQTMMEDWCKRTAVIIGGQSLGAIALLSHLVIINGSPRVAKFSNTDKIIHSFVKGLEETGITWELHNLSNRKEWDAAREAFLTHECKW